MGLMKSRVILCLALVLSGRAAQTNVVAPTNFLEKIVSPQGSVDLPKLGQVVFSEQTSKFSLQVPIGFRTNGGKSPGSNQSPDLQTWLLKTDGTSIHPLCAPSVITFPSVGNCTTDYIVYTFSKVPVNELSGVAVSVNRQLYSHEIEKTGLKPSSLQDDHYMVHVTPANIHNYPISVRATNVDSYEHITVCYKTDRTSDKFIDAWQEISDAGSIISSNSIQKTWTGNGFEFALGGGYVSPIKFKMIEAAHGHDTAAPGFKGYWFFLRDFAAEPLVLDREKITRYDDARMGEIIIPGLSLPLSFTEQPTQFVVEMPVATHRDDENTIPTMSELHRQVWLLRLDGTTIPQAHEPILGGTGGGGCSTWHLVYTFQRKPINEVAGIVVSVNGKLYFRELPNVWRILEVQHPPVRKR